MKKNKIKKIASPLIKTQYNKDGSFRKQEELPEAYLKSAPWTTPHTQSKDHQKELKQR